jgi:hypothetical protein
MQVLPSLNPTSLLNLSSSGASGSAAAPRPPPVLTTFSQHLRSVSTGEGIRSLWRGVASVILGAGPAHAAHFGMYEFIREISGGREVGWWGVGGTGESCWCCLERWLMWSALAGAAATVTSDALMNPFDGVSYVVQGQRKLTGSHQATYANPQFPSPYSHGVCSISLPRRRSRCILRLVPYDHHHDCPIYRCSIFSL